MANSRKLGTKIAVMSATLLLPLSSHALQEPSQFIRSVAAAVAQGDSLPDHYSRTTTHIVNQLALGVSNRGAIAQSGRDAFTGDTILGHCEFPRGSRRDYLEQIDLWLGVQGSRDPVVSNGYYYLAEEAIAGEWLPSSPPGEFVRRSITDRFGGPDAEAVSEEDLLCTYDDSLGLWKLGDHLAPNPLSLGAFVRQASYAWSMTYAEDFAIVRLDIRNEGTMLWRETYAGLHIIPSVGLRDPCEDCGPKWTVCGIRTVAPAAFGCDHLDTLNTAWHATASGDPYEGEWLENPLYDSFRKCYYGSTRGIIGILPLCAPHPAYTLHYNWWASVLHPDPEEGIFSFQPSQDALVPSYVPGFVYVNTDKSRYRLLAANEVDYPSYQASRIASTPFSGWLPVPPELANAVSSGVWPEALLSWGPFDVSPGGRFSIVFAVVGGEDFHTDPSNYRHLPARPDLYEAGVNFSDLDRNALMAQWVYDNPGIDTDGDGYSGEYRVCVRDSMLMGNRWVVKKPNPQCYRGDGIPDYRGALSPPAPHLWVTPIHNGFHVRFNGEKSETAKDIFLQCVDFEGYRIYLGRDERRTSLSVVASYDREDYTSTCFWPIRKEVSPGGSWMNRSPCRSCAVSTVLLPIPARILPSTR